MKIFKTLSSLLLLLTFTSLQAQKETHSEKWNETLQEHVSAEGKVDYLGFRKDETQLDQYLHFLSETVPTKEASKNEKLAYWINAYNAFTVKLILKHYPIKSIQNLREPWKQKFIKLGDQPYSLEQIENDILRSFGDPRIHFAINCASQSCPKLNNHAYQAAKINKQLDDAVTSFLEDSSKNEIQKNKISVSKIFDWYQDDFKEAGGVIPFINQFSKINVDASARIEYKKYDWNLNE